MRTPRHPVAAAILAAASAHIATAQVPSFNFVGVAPGLASSRTYALSADGRVATGYSTLSSIATGYVWSASSGRYDFGLESGLPRFTEGLAISADGSIVVGLSGGLSQSSRAFVWSGPGTFQTLGVIPTYTDSLAEGVSGDGSVIVGRSEAALGLASQAFRWTAASGMQPLGFAPGDINSDAFGISRDGNTIVGYTGNPNGNTNAFRWTSAAGIQILPQLPGTTTPNSAAYGINFDGSIIVGSSGPIQTAAMWRGEQVIQLGTPAGWFYSVARTVSDNGNVAAGLFAGGASPNTAAVWTADGPARLADYLTANGVTIPAGWTLQDCTGISQDGLTFAGIAKMGATLQGFVATVPAPSAAAAALLGAGLLAARRQRG